MILKKNSLITALFHRSRISHYVIHKYKQPIQNQKSISKQQPIIIIISKRKQINRAGVRAVCRIASRHNND